MEGNEEQCVNVGEITITVVHKPPPPHPVQKDPFPLLWQHSGFDSGCGGSCKAFLTCGLLEKFPPFAKELRPGRFQATYDKSQSWFINPEARFSSVTYLK